MEYSVIIKGLGSYLPKRVMTNDDLAKIVDTSDEWIRTRTGISERHIADESESTSVMSANAAEVAIRNANIAKEAIDGVIVATLTPDMPFPCTAALVQARLGLKTGFAFDLEAACSGFIYALEVASKMVKSGAYKNILIIGAEKLSSILDWQDRTTCVLLGDGAGAAIVSRCEESGYGVLGATLMADGNFAHLLSMPAGGSVCPASEKSVQDRQHFFKMNGKETFKVAVKYMEQASLSALQAAGLSLSNVDLVVPHQANQRIIEALVERLGVAPEKCFCNLSRVGNTSAASVPIALHQAYCEGKLKHGERILLVAFGAGLTCGSVVFRHFDRP